MREAGKPGMSDEEVCLLTFLFLYFYLMNSSSLECPNRTCRVCILKMETEVFRELVLQVKDFVSRYLPAYNAYFPTLYFEGPNGSDPKHLPLIEIDEGRNPILGN